MSNKHFEKRIHDKKRLLKLWHKNTTCMFCGLPTNMPHSNRGYAGFDWNLEHIIPVSLLKWYTCYDCVATYDRLESAINSDGNICVVHGRCNARKGCKAYSPERLLSTYYVTDEVANGYYSVYEEIEDAITGYNAFISRILLKQNNKCYVCGCNIRDAVLRRIDDSKERCVENAAIVCPKCSYRNRNRHGKGVLR